MEHMAIKFDAEVLEVKAKKDGLDRLYRVILETNQPAVLELQKFIAENTVIVEVNDGQK
jgi:hypothetical protein